MEVLIRNFKREDWREVSKLLDKDLDYNYIDSFLEDKSVFAYVACISDEIVGMIYGYILKRIESKPMVYIHSVDVLASHRKKGIGTMMINEVISFAKDNDYKKLFVITDKSNSNAMKLYLKTGGKSKDSVVFNYI